MRLKKIYILFMLFVFCPQSKGQEPDTLSNSLLHSVQLEKLSTMSDSKAIFSLITIQIQIIDNMRKMIRVLYEEQKTLETKMDSILNSSENEEFSMQEFSQIEISPGNKLPDGYTYYSIEKAKQSPMSVFELDLSKNALTNVPDEIKQFDNLQKLILSDNLLVELPHWIDQLKALQYIYLSNNQFQSFPESLTKIKSLILVDLSCNPIRYVTTDIKKCPNLKVLNLHHSKINYKKMRRLELTLGEVIKK